MAITPGMQGGEKIGRKRTFVIAKKTTSKENHTVKKEEALQIMQQIDEAGQGELEGKLKITFLENDSYSVERPDRDEHGIASAEEAAKQIRGFSNPEAFTFTTNEAAEEPQPVDADEAPEEDDEAEASAPKIGQREYGIWIKQEGGEKRLLRKFEGTQADGYCMLLKVQAENTDAEGNEPEVALRPAKDEDGSGRVIVHIQAGGFKNVDEEFLRTSDLYAELGRE